MEELAMAHMSKVTRRLKVQHKK